MREPGQMAELLKITRDPGIKNFYITDQAIIGEEQFIGPDGKSTILTGRLSYVFSYFVRLIGNRYTLGGLTPDKPGQRIDIVKLFRLRHHASGRRRRDHVVGYAVYSETGIFGINRDDGREIKPEIFYLHKRPWFQIPCSTPGCKEAFQVSGDGHPIISGMVDRHDTLRKQWVPIPQEHVRGVVEFH